MIHSLCFVDESDAKTTNSSGNEPTLPPLPSNWYTSGLLVSLNDHFLLDCVQRLSEEGWEPKENILYKDGLPVGLQGATILVAHAPKSLSSATEHFPLWHQCTWTLAVNYYHLFICLYIEVITISCCACCDLNQEKTCIFTLIPGFDQRAEIFTLIIHQLWSFRPTSATRVNAQALIFESNDWISLNYYLSMKHTDLFQVGKQRQRRDHLLIPP